MPDPPGLLLRALFWASQLLGIASLFYPWSFTSRNARVLAHLPILAMGLYLTYEVILPVEYNIRVDLLLALPILGLAMIAWYSKMILIARQNRASEQPTTSFEPPHGHSDGT